MNRTFFNKLVKTAHENPTLRPQLLPLIKEAKEAMDKTAEPRYRDYVRRFKGPGSPMSKEDWERKVLGPKTAPKPEKKPEGKGEESKGEEKVKVPGAKAIGEILSQWHGGGSDIIYQVSSHLNGDRPIPIPRLQEAAKKLQGMIDNADAQGISQADVKELTKAVNALNKATGDSGKAKAPEDKPASKPKKPAEKKPAEKKPEKKPEGKGEEKPEGRPTLKEDKDGVTDPVKMKAKGIGEKLRKDGLVMPGVAKALDAGEPVSRARLEYAWERLDDAVSTGRMSADDEVVKAVGAALGKKPSKAPAKKPTEKKPEEKAKHPVPKSMYEYIGGKAPAIQKAIDSGKPIDPKDAKQVIDLLEKALQGEKDGKAVIDATTKKHYKALVKHLKALPAGEAEKPTEKKPAEKKPYKKKYHPSVTKVMDKYSLHDDDADEVKKFKKTKPDSDTSVPPAVLLQRFLAKAKPETKKRMMGPPKISVGDFMAMLKAIGDEEA